MKKLMIALAIAHAMDATSTCRDFRKGSYEMNPFVPSNCAAVITASVGSSLVSDYFAILLKRRGHERVAKWFLGAETAVETGVSVANWRR